MEVYSVNMGTARDEGRTCRGGLRFTMRATLFASRALVEHASTCDTAPNMAARGEVGLEGSSGPQSSSPAVGVPVSDNGQCVNLCGGRREDGSSPRASGAPRGLSRHCGAVVQADSCAAHKSLLYARTAFVTRVQLSNADREGFRRFWWGGHSTSRLTVCERSCLVDEGQETTRATAPVAR